MKLISCHIENYGKISGADINFDGDFTSFCEANGYGKTTIASFLKAMFYGLDSDRINSGFNERRHFNPFGGGNFGGNITFLCGDKIYRAERFFDEKSETRDSFTLYIDGKAVEAPECLGERIFGIDRQSFERTVFISAEEIEISSTGSINTKLNNFIEGGTDDANLEVALSRLENRSKIYKKSRQGNDLITQENQRILKLTEEIANIEIIASGLPDKYVRLDGAEQEIRELTKTIAASQNTNLVLNNWQHYDRMTAEISNLERQVKDIEDRYPHGVPSAEEAASVAEAINRDKTLKASGQQKLFSGMDETNFAVLYSRFADGLPSEVELKGLEKKIREHSSIAYDIEASKNERPTQKEEKLRQRFAHHIPSQVEMDALDAMAEKYRNAEAQMNGIPVCVSAADAEKSARKPLNKLYVVLAIFSTVLLLGGVATVFVSLVAGIILLVFGVIGLAVTGFLYLNKKTNLQVQAGQSVNSENPLKLSTRRLMESTANEIQAFLMPYGYSLSNGVAYAVAEFKEDLQSYNELLVSAEENRRKAEDKLMQKRRLSDEITSFFSGYKITGDNFVRQLADLRSDINAFNSLKARKELSAANEIELQGKIITNRRSIIDFCENYRFDIELLADKINMISNDIRDLQSKRKTLKEKREEADCFRNEKQLTDRPAVQTVDLMALNERLAKLQDTKNSLLSEITGDEYEVEKLENLRNELSDARGKSYRYKRTYELLTKTMAALKQADKRLKDKYVKPIKDKFVYYASVLEKALGEKITMGTDFEIRYERNGRERSEKHLSSGQRSICALCFRLALIENMYSDEKPFLILDDPFVHLDNEHLEKVKAMLKELSQRLQIIYFACHQSRAI